MEVRRRLPSLRLASLWTVLLATAVLFGCSDQGVDAPTTPDAARGGPAAGLAGSQGFQEAIRAQEAHTDELLQQPGVVGTAVGLEGDDEFSVVIYLMRPEAAQGLPDRLEDVPVRHVVTGPFVADADETSRQRPAPIGFSVGHPDITAGTIGARVDSASGDLFILSNNHVLANTNEASIGDPSLQPGPYDGGDADDEVGQLADYEPLAFDGSVNYIDAAISATHHDSVGFETSDEGYGTPNSTIYDLDGDGDPDKISGVSSNLVGVGVQKYGRTTGLTTGEVEEVNVSVTVCYECGNFLCTTCSKSAYFEDQISITPGDFSDGGDSGSLIVTNDSGLNPVGLLYAGSSSRTLANRIDRCLVRFTVGVDDDAEDGDSPPSVSITNPSDGETVSGTVTISADASDDGSVSQVEFFVDGSSIGIDSDGDDGWSTSWNTENYSDGDHTVTAEATDTADQTSSDQIGVTVDNTDDPPSVTITNPSDGETVSGTVTISADASDDGSVSQVEFFVDGSSIGIDSDGDDGWSTSWNTENYSDGDHTVTAEATDDAGQTSSASITVTVDNAAGGIHVGDLDGSQSNQGSTWTATVSVLVHDGSHNAEGGSTVSFDYDSRDVSGSTSCTTGSGGACSVSVSGIPKRTGSVTFTVTGISDDDGSYDATANHDPDGDSDGTTITVNKP